MFTPRAVMADSRPMFRIASEVFQLPENMLFLTVPSSTNRIARMAKRTGARQAL